MFDFRQITLFCVEYSLSKHKRTICSKGWHAPLGPPLATPMVGGAVKELRAMETYKKQKNRY